MLRSTVRDNPPYSLSETLLKRTFISLGLGAGLLLAATPSFAAVEYVRVCTIYGAGFHYIPGTDTCLNESTGDARVQTEGGTWRSLLPYPEGKWTTSPVLECGFGRHVNLGSFASTDFTPNPWNRRQTQPVSVPVRSGEFISKVTMSGGFYDPRIPNRSGANGQNGLCVRSVDPTVIERISPDTYENPPFGNGKLPIACVANSRIMGMPAAYTVSATAAYPSIDRFIIDANGTVSGPYTYGTQLVVTTDFGSSSFWGELAYYDTQGTPRPLAGRVSVSVCIEQGTNQSFVSPAGR